MTDYYAQFKPEADILALTLAKTVKTLSAELPKIRHRLDVEKGDAQKLKDRIESLKATTGEVYADQNAYATFKVNFRKREAELDASQEAIRLIETEVLPEKQRKLDLARANLSIILNAFMLRSRGTADKIIDEHIIACITERQSFLDDFKKLYAEYGLQLVISDESYCPGRWWTDAEIRNMRKTLCMDGQLPPDPNPIRTAARGASIPPVEQSAGGSKLPSEAVSAPEVEFTLGRIQRR